MKKGVGVLVLVFILLNIFLLFSFAQENTTITEEEIPSVIVTSTAYQLPEHSYVQDPVVVGQPVKWTLDILNSTIEYETPPIQLYSNFESLNQQWSLDVTVYSESTVGYENVSVVVVTPQTLDVDLSFDTNYSISQLADFENSEVTVFIPNFKSKKTFTISGSYVQDGESTLLLDVSKTRNGVYKTQKPAKARESVKWDVTVHNTSVVSIPRGATNIIAAANGKRVLLNSTAGLHDFVSGSLSINRTEELVYTLPDIGSGASVTITYDTPAPTVREGKFANGKKRVIVESDFHYENVLTYADIPETRQGDVKVEWLINGSRVPIRIENFIDADNDGLIDGIEWIAPHLSTQEFEIILITQAYHLDTARELIGSIYEDVYRYDGNYSDPIYHEEYVRVTFEKNLTSQKDITVYVRNTEQTNTRIEVFKANTTELVGTFPVITTEDYYQILLTNMSGIEDEFDLRIDDMDDDSDAYLEFDLIIDPVASPADAILLKAQTCGSNTDGTENLFPNACDGTVPAACGAGGDFISCDDTTALETHSARLNQYAGVNASYFNTSITNCDSLDSVQVCFEWYADKGNLADCEVSFDDGFGGFILINSTCPGTTAPGVHCQDVSNTDGAINSVEGWACNDFFGASATGGKLRSQLDKSAAAGGPALITWDALYFNVSYTGDTTPPVVNLNGQANDSWFGSLTQDYLYTATDTHLDTCQVYTDFGGTWGADDTNASVISGEQDTVSLTAPADGTYIWNVLCNDTGGFSAYNATNYTINLDTTAPTIALNNPIDRLNTTSTSLAFNWTPTDNLAPTVDCNLTVDGSIEATTVQVSSGSWVNRTVTSLSEGIHTWSVTCQDDTGNSFTTANREFRVDVTDPVPVAIFPLTLYNTTSTTINFNWSITDNLHDLPVCDLYVDGSLNVSGIDSPNGTWTNQVVNGFSDGAHTWNVTCTDDAGNAGTFSVENFQVDTTAPVVNLEFPDNTDWRNYTPVVFEYNVSDAITGVQNCSLWIDGSQENSSFSITQGITQQFAGAVSEGSSTWDVRCTDNLGNTGNGGGRTINLDFTNPLFSTNEVNGTDFGINTYACLNVTVSDTNTITSVKANVLFPGSGLMNVTLTNSASCGNAGGNVYAAELLIDESGQYNWSRMYVEDVAENINDSYFTFITFNATSSFFMNLTQHSPLAAIEINESDDTRNYSFIQSCTVECDIASSGSCEDVTLFSQYRDTDYKYVNLTSTILYANQTNATCGSITPGGTCSSEFNITTTTIANADFDRLRCYASSSNTPVNFSTYQNVTINDHPVALFIPTNTSHLADTESLDASSSTDDQGIATYTFDYDNNTAFSSPTSICSGAPATCNFDTTQPAQVQCVEDSTDCFIRLRITDSDGLTNETIHEHTVDNTAPSVDLDSPLNDTWITTTTQTFQYTATDAALTNCTLYHNQTGVFTDNVTNSSVLSGVQDSQTISLPEGRYIWNVQCADLAQNTVFNATNYTIKVDTTDPAVTLNQPGDTSALGYNGVQFNITPTDTYLDNCTLYGNWSGSWAVNTTILSPNSGILNSFTLQTLPDGNHKWNAYCQDESGRGSFAASNFTFSVDTSAPVAFALLTPTNNTQSNDATPLLTWEEANDITFDNYTIQFDTDEAFSSPTEFYTLHTFTNTTYTIPGGTPLSANTQYFWRVIAYDQFELSTVSTDYFTYITDSINPIVNLEIPANYTNYTANSAIQFDFNITETNSIANCTVMLNGVEDVDDAIFDPVNGSTVEIFKTPIDNGLYYWNVTCFDYAGNSGTSETRFLNISVDYPAYTFYPTSTSNTATPNLLQYNDGTENSNAVTCTANNLYTLSTATSGIENKGIILIGNQVAEFAGDFDVPRLVHATFEVYYDNGTGFTTYVRDGDDFTGGTNVALGRTAIIANNNVTESEDVYLNGSHSLRLITRLYRPGGGGSGTCTQFWDDTSSMTLKAYNLSDLHVNLTEPLTDTQESENTDFNVTCETSCPGGWCMNTKVAVQINTSPTQWTDINSSSGNIILGDVQSNPVTLGNINTSILTNITLHADVPSTNKIRCVATSDYSDVNGTTERNVTVLDITPPVIVAHDALADPAVYGNNFTIFANVTDNVNVHTVLVELDDVNYTMVATGRDDEFSYEFNSTAYTNGTFTYRIDANDTSNNNATEQNGTVEIRSIELTVDSITFDPVEGVENEDSTVSVFVRNYGGANASNVNVTLQIYLWSGSWGLVETQSQLVDVRNSITNHSNFTWNAQIGLYQFNATVDYPQVVYELDETDNVFSRNYSISSYEIYYGTIPYNLELFATTSTTFNEWPVSTVSGNTYFSDIDSNFVPFDLLPLNESGDLVQADTALGMSNVNDTLSIVWDKDQSGDSDETGTFTVGGLTHTTIPIVNSTNSSSFITGLMWDSADGGSSYDGSQDLVFVVRVNESKAGLYGTYDYEAKIPALLRSLEPSTDQVLISFEYQ